MRRIDVSAGLDLGRLEPAHRLHGVVSAALRARGEPAVAAAPPWWAPEVFGLDRVAAWREARPEQRAAVVERLGRATLAEAWWIESVGMAFAAKMTLLARTLEERQLYALVGAEEATHLAWFSAWVAPDGPPGPFLDHLARLVEAADRATLVLVVQVVLEGWGLQWYRQLQAASLDPGLAAVFERVLADEARHHGGGVVLAQEAPCPDDAVDALAPILEMVRAGPQGVVAALEAGLGPLDRRRAFAELDAEGHAAARLSLLRGLLLKGRAGAAVDALESRGLFTPLPPERCA